MKKPSFAKYVERHDRIIGFSTLIAEYKSDPRLFEAFLFKVDADVKQYQRHIQLNELNLGRVGRAFGIGNKPAAAAPAPAPAAKPGISDDEMNQFKQSMGVSDQQKQGQYYQSLLTDLKSSYPTENTPEATKERNAVTKDPKRLQQAIPKVQKIIQFLTKTGTNVDSWNRTLKGLQAAENEHLPFGKDMKDPVIITSKTVTDTLQKMINHPHVKAWFQGDKAPIMKTMIDSWNAFKKEVKEMQKDPRYPAPQKAAVPGPASGPAASGPAPARPAAAPVR